MQEKTRVQAGSDVDGQRDEADMANQTTNILEARYQPLEGDPHELML